MNNHKNIIFIIVANILILFLIVFISDISIYKYYASNYYKTHPTIYKINQFKYMPYLPEYIVDLESYFNGENNIFFGRLPDGTEYKNKVPIVIFGCSYGFGQHLDYKQTLSYKLAHIFQRPVYNRSISGGSFQHMYMQSLSESFYKTIPISDTVIYVMIGDHYRRSKLWYFDVLDIHLYPHFHKNKNRLIMDNPYNPFLNFFKSIYTVKYFNHIYTDRYIKNHENSEEITNESLLYFIETRKELEKHWNKKIKFIILLYEDWDIMYKKEFINKLKNNNFIVISTKEITDENLRDEKYQMQENHHPTEKAWDLLIPQIIERLKL